jgi:hypothetical protein
MFCHFRHAGETSIFSICDGRVTCVNPALYAVIGASALLGGITRMTGELRALVQGIWLFVLCSL